MSCRLAFVFVLFPLLVKGTAMTLVPSHEIESLTFHKDATTISTLEPRQLTSRNQLECTGSIVCFAIKQVICTQVNSVWTCRTDDLDPSIFVFNATVKCDGHRRTGDPIVVKEGCSVSLHVSYKDDFLFSLFLVFVFFYWLYTRPIGSGNNREGNDNDNDNYSDDDRTCQSSSVSFEST